MLKSITFAAIAALGFSFQSAMAASSHRCTIASYYGVGDGFHGKMTANGERFNAHGKTAAHPSLPFGTRVLITNPSNKKTVVVRINDRGPFHGGRGIDLSYGAFGTVASTSSGVAKICYSVLI